MFVGSEHDRLLRNSRLSTIATITSEDGRVLNQTEVLTIVKKAIEHYDEAKGRFKKIFGHRRDAQPIQKLREYQCKLEQASAKGLLDDQDLQLQVFQCVFTEFTQEGHASAEVFQQAKTGLKKLLVDVARQKPQVSNSLFYRWISTLVNCPILFSRLQCSDIAKKSIWFSPSEMIQWVGELAAETTADNFEQSPLFLEFQQFTVAADEGLLPLYADKAGFSDFFKLVIKHFFLLKELNFAEISRNEDFCLSWKAAFKLFSIVLGSVRGAINSTNFLLKKFERLLVDDYFNADRVCWEKTRNLFMRYPNLFCNVDIGKLPEDGMNREFLLEFFKQFFVDRTKRNIEFAEMDFKNMWQEAGLISAFYGSHFANFFSYLCLSYQEQIFSIDLDLILAPHFFVETPVGGSVASSSVEVEFIHSPMQEHFEWFKHLFHHLTTVNLLTSSEMNFIFEHAAESQYFAIAVVTLSKIKGLDAISFGLLKEKIENINQLIFPILRLALSGTLRHDAPRHTLLCDVLQSQDPMRECEDILFNAAEAVYSRNQSSRTWDPSQVALFLDIDFAYHIQSLLEFAIENEGANATLLSFLRNISRIFYLENLIKDLIVAPLKPQDIQTTSLILLAWCVDDCLLLEEETVSNACLMEHTQTSSLECGTLQSENSARIDEEKKKKPELNVWDDWKKTVAREVESRRQGKEAEKANHLLVYLAGNVCLKQKNEPEKYTYDHSLYFSTLHRLIDEKQQRSGVTQSTELPVAEHHALPIPRRFLIALPTLILAYTVNFYEAKKIEECIGWTHPPASLSYIFPLLSLCDDLGLYLSEVYEWVEKGHSFRKTFTQKSAYIALTPGIAEGVLLTAFLYQDILKMNIRGLYLIMALTAVPSIFFQYIISEGGYMEKLLRVPYFAGDITYLQEQRQHSMKRILSVVLANSIVLLGALGFLQVIYFEWKHLTHGLLHTELSEEKVETMSLLVGVMMSLFSAVGHLSLFSISTKDFLYYKMKTFGKWPFYPENTSILVKGKIALFAAFCIFASVCAVPSVYQILLEGFSNFEEAREKTLSPFVRLFAALCAACTTVEYLSVKVPKAIGFFCSYVLKEQVLAHQFEGENTQWNLANVTAPGYKMSWNDLLSLNTLFNSVFWFSSVILAQIANQLLMDSVDPEKTYTLRNILIASFFPVLVNAAFFATFLKSNTATERFDRENSIHREEGDFHSTRCCRISLCFAVSYLFTAGASVLSKNFVAEEWRWDVALGVQGALSLFTALGLFAYNFKIKWNASFDLRNLQKYTPELFHRSHGTRTPAEGLNELMMPNIQYL